MVATTGEEALTILRFLSGGVGALVADMQLPDMSGRELVHYNAPYLAGAPVLYISGVAAPPELRVGLARNASFLGKPFALDDLRSRLGQMLTPRP